MAVRPARGPERVPVRTIAATIGMVLGTALALLLLWEMRRILTWIVVAAFLAVILGPLTSLVERRLHLRRSLAAVLVFLLGFLALAGIFTAFVRPLAVEGPKFEPFGVVRANLRAKPAYCYLAHHLGGMSACGSER